MTNLAKHEDIKKQSVTCLENVVPLETKPTLGVQLSLAWNSWWDGAIQNFLVGLLYFKGHQRSFRHYGFFNPTGNDVLDFHMNRYLVWSVCFFNLEIKTSPIAKLIIKSNTLLHIISSSWISMHLNKEEGTCYFRKCQKINQYSIRWPFNVH